MARTVGFFTDTTLCIGCKACEVACKEWNQLPGHAPQVRRRLRQHRPARRAELAPRAVPRAHHCQGRRRLEHDERRLQALRAGELHGSVSDQRHHPDRVRHRLHPAERLQRLPGLHRRLPVPRHRLRRGIGAGSQVHVLLRPPAGQPDAGVRQGLPDGVDQVRRAEHDARDRRRAAEPAPRSGHGGGAAVRRQGVRRAARPVPAHRQA